jgi:hypothetical protein
MEKSLAKKVIEGLEGLGLSTRVSTSAPSPPSGSMSDLGVAPIVPLAIVTGRQKKKRKRYGELILGDRND